MSNEMSNEREWRKTPGLIGPDKLLNEGEFKALQEILGQHNAVFVGRVLRQILDGAAALREQHDYRWRKLSEEKPRFNHHYLVFLGKRHPNRPDLYGWCIWCWDANTKTGFSGDGAKFITHWRPLPSPPRS